ncbi:MAG TPA: efflux RND transporter periplasmic adaptor subunit [Terriglobales bacterium]|nr:efflux RND transporter periplasmic adaptor subunit [Terriglobales bacterium]
MTLGRTRKSKLPIIVAAVVIPAAVFIFVRTTGAASPAVPTAEVKKGDFVEYLQVRGEIRARKSKIINAPSGSGDLQLVKLVPTGTMVKKDDIVAQFDPTNLQRTLDQKKSELRQAQAEIERQRAEGHMSEAQAETEAEAAKYGVEKATLDTKKQEILSEIEGEKTKLTLASSEQKLLESKERVKSGKISTSANVELRKKKSEKAQYDVELAERQIASLTLRSPSDGMVTALPNFRATMFGGNPPDFKEGDRAWPGAAVAEIPDLSEIRFEARIDESDRGKLKAAQGAMIRVDAVPEKEFSAKIRDISTLAKLDFSGWPPTKNFSIDIQIESTDARVRPGMSANSRIEVNRVPDSILVPVGSVFQKQGRQVVYVLKGTSFEERVVTIGRRNSSQAQVLAGLKVGEKVATKDPIEAVEKK